MMKLSRKEVAQHFSNGEFDKAIDYLDEDIVWEIVGENVFKGKKAVITNCIQTTAYFNSVETNFKTNDITTTENKVIITGTAEFKKNGKVINCISACDIYNFNDVNEMIKITSYCIAEKKE